MSQLYSMLDQVSSTDEQREDTKLDTVTSGVTELLDTLSADLENRIDLTSTALEHIAIGERIDASLREQPLGSKEYFACLENNTSVLSILAQRMGAVKVPAMEDFKNEYALRSSHEIALESVANFLKNTWEAIKKFFKDFFKKVLVFMKRIVHANLELEEYEKYNDQLVAKLKSNNAKITDNSPIQTKLAIYLADKGQETVDSDFVLRNGMTKVNALTALIDAIGRNDARFFNKNQLISFRQSLEMVVKFYNKKIDSDVSKAVSEHADTLRIAGANLLKSIFTVPISDTKNLPEEVYEKMFDDFSTASMKTGDIEMLSMVDHLRVNSMLPMDTNMFLAHQNNQRFFVTGYKSTNAYTKGEIPPISNLSNLVKFHDMYKKDVKGTNMAGCLKAVEAVEEEISNVLDILSTRYVKLVENVNYTTSPDEIFYRNFLMALRDSGMDGNRYRTTYPYDTDHDIDECIYQLCELAQLPDLGPSVEEMMNRKNWQPKVLELAIIYLGKVADLDMNRVRSGKIDAAVIDNYKKLQDLNNFLTHVFSKLQIIFRSIVSDIFATYTEIRYELVRYIYETSRRYSY